MALVYEKWVCPGMVVRQLIYPSTLLSSSFYRTPYVTGNETVDLSIDIVSLKSPLD